MHPGTAHWGAADCLCEQTARKGQSLGSGGMELGVIALFSFPNGLVEFFPPNTNIARDGEGKELYSIARRQRLGGKLLEVTLQGNVHDRTVRTRGAVLFGNVHDSEWKAIDARLEELRSGLWRIIRQIPTVPGTNPESRRDIRVSELYQTQGRALWARLEIQQLPTLAFLGRRAQLGTHSFGPQFDLSKATQAVIWTTTPENPPEIASEIPAVRIFSMPKPADWKSPEEHRAAAKETATAVAVAAGAAAN